MSHHESPAAGPLPPVSAVNALPEGSAADARLPDDDHDAA
jgi:hypothetical protein